METVSLANAVSGQIEPVATRHGLQYRRLFSKPTPGFVCDVDTVRDKLVNFICVLVPNH